MRVVFMGTPEFSLKVLKALIDNYEVVGVVTKKDAFVGKKKVLTMSPVKKMALEYNIKCLEPERLKKEYKDIIDLNPDLIITCAYGKLLNDELLTYPRYGCINVHASLLPRLRGGAPIHKALIYGEEYTGITIMYMDKKMDEGDILAQEKIKIDDSDNVLSLHEKLSEIGANLLIKSLPDIINKRIKPVKQLDNLATYAYNVTREEERIIWNKSLKDVFNQIRGLYPWPVAYTTLDNINIKILASAKSDLEKTDLPGKIFIQNKKLYVNVLDGVLEIKELMVEGKKKCTGIEFINGQGKKILEKETQFL